MLDLGHIADQQIYTHDQAAIFFRSKETHGVVSNMTGGMHLNVNGFHFQSSEGLYQALKYPSMPDIQKRIGSISSGLFAKNVAYSKAYRPFLVPNWDSIRVDATIAILAIKLQQHPTKFGDALRATGNLPIVKRTPTTDTFWGAILQPDGSVVGGNALGKMLTELRDLLVEIGDSIWAANEFATNVVQPDMLQINGKRVELNATNSPLIQQLELALV